MRDGGREGVSEGLKVEKGEIEGERGTKFYTMRERERKKSRVKQGE